MARKTSALSKELRKIRIDLEISRAKMAASIGLTDRQLAAVENGSGNAFMSYEAEMKLYQIYAPHDEDGEDEYHGKLRRAVRDSMNEITIDLRQATDAEKIAILNARDNFLGRLNRDSEAAKAKAAEKRKAKQKTDSMESFINANEGVAA